MLGSLLSGERKNTGEQFLIGSRAGTIAVTGITHPNIEKKREKGAQLLRRSGVRSIR